MCVLKKSYFLWESQAKTLYVWPKPCLGTRAKIQLEILTINVVSGIVYFQEIVLESSRNVSEILPWLSGQVRGQNTSMHHFLSNEVKSVIQEGS